MVRKPCLKGVPGCGCKEKCGSKTGDICCCSHTCGAICVKIIGGCENESGVGTGFCSCEEPSFTYLEYDPITHSYHGTIGCGDVSIDLEFVVKYCPDYPVGTGTETEGTCVLCLLSDCLVEAETIGTGTVIGTGTGDDLFDGSCTNLVSCKPIANGNVSCIGIRDDENNLDGGIEHEWDVNVSGCGDSNCSAFTIISKCTPRIFPEELTTTLGTGTGTEGCGCTGCFCTCRDLCISYVGTVPCTSGARVPFENNGWEFELSSVEGCDEDEVGRSISIILRANEETGVCELFITTSLAVGTGTAPDTTLETIITLNDCPDIPFTKIFVDEDANEYFTFECWKCGACPEELICVCECDPDSEDGRGFDIGRTLSLDWEATNNSGTGSGTISLERFEEECRWEGTYILNCVDSDSTVYQRIYTASFYPDGGVDLNYCGWVISVTATNRIGTTPYTPLDNSCTDEHLDQIVQWSEAGNTYDVSCQCDPFSMTYAALPSEDESIGMEVTEG